MITTASPVLSPSWVSPTYIANLYGYSTRMVRKWCYNGFLIHHGCTIHQDSRKRWWIKLPPDPIKPRKFNYLS